MFQTESNTLYGLDYVFWSVDGIHSGVWLALVPAGPSRLWHRRSPSVVSSLLPEMKPALNDT